MAVFFPYQAVRHHSHRPARSADCPPWQETKVRCEPPLPILKLDAGFFYQPGQSLPDPDELAAGLRSLDFTDACNLFESVIEGFPVTFANPATLRDLGHKLARRADQMEREQS